MANIAGDMREPVLNYLARGEAPPALTGPMRVQLLSALGTGGAAGTPIAGAIVTANFGAGAADATTNGATLRWEGLANPTTVAGFRVIDSAATPVVTLDNIARRNADGVVEAATVTDGIFEVPAGDLDLTAA